MRPSVLMVTGAYYPELSGAGLQCRQLVRALRDKVTFAVLTTAAPDGPLPGEESGIPVWRVPVDAARRLSKVGAVWRMTVAFLRFSPRFGIVHFHGFSQKTLLLIVLARLLGKRTVLKLTSVGHDDPASIRSRGAVSYWCYQAVDRYIGVSLRQETLYRESGLPAGKFRLIPNGVDLDRFRPGNDEEKRTLRNELGLPPEIPLILFVGFFSSDKRPDILFHAWKRLCVGSPIGLVFVGATRSRYYEVDRHLARRIRDEAQHSEYGDQVRFVETTDEIEKYYRTADFFALPSIREGLPNALLEAMASGLPCVASTLNGVTDWIVEHGKNGILVPTDDIGALHDALDSLLRDPARAKTLGQEARVTVERRFSIRQTASQCFDVYAGLCA